MNGKKYWMQRGLRQAPPSVESKQTKQTKEAKEKKAAICPQCDLSKIY